MIPASIERYLTAHHVRYTPLSHVRAITAQEEAAVTHTPGRAWAKTVICVADNAPIQAVVPADRVVDPARLRELVGARSLRIAEEDEFAAAVPGLRRRRDAAVRHALRAAGVRRSDALRRLGDRLQRRHAHRRDPDALLGLQSPGASRRRSFGRRVAH